MSTIKAGEIQSHELIGLKVEVSEDSNPCNTSISGEVIDETKNMLVVRQKGKVKRVAKQDAVFRFKLPDGSMVEVDGSTLLGRPEDRVKKRNKRFW